ncbi:MAG: Mur ligase family protein [Acidimicrobiales bacterium]
MRVAVDVLLGMGLALAVAAQLARWLRVLQREHYEPSAPGRFLWRWSCPPVGAASRRSRRRPVTASIVLVVVVAVLAAAGLDRWAAAATILYGLACPIGLSPRGRTGPLRWTRRLTTVAIVAVVLVGVAGVAVAAPHPWLVALAVVWLVPLLVGLSAALLGPAENRRAQRFVDQAVARLAKVRPRVVAITGSYGKTSTKSHLVDLLGSDAGVVASPRSFNNRAGLSRAINDQVSDDTRVFVAEMGTYGPGEIRALCAWCPPEIAVVTAIGPVHLERMGSLDVVEAAKHEVTERARAVVLNLDDERLAGWVADLVAAGRRVRTAGTSAGADVRVTGDGDSWTLVVDGDARATLTRPAGVQTTNAACAVAAALELGADVAHVAARLARLTPVEHRATVATAPSGVVVIDDTFNANPAGAVSALATLTALASPGRRLVVTPGLVELGDAAVTENRDLGARVAAANAELVVVGRTNARALLAGFAGEARRVDTRDEAVAWVRATLGAGDAVLYLNDLPDHYP